MLLKAGNPHNAQVAHTSR